MLKRFENIRKPRSLSGQNMVEYILVFVVIVLTLVVALSPGGFLNKKIDDTVNMAMTGAKCLALKTCFDPEGCPFVVGNGCCESGETVHNSPEDCSYCLSDADCDDGYACNGAEWCDPASGCQPDPAGGICDPCNQVSPPLQHGQCSDYFPPTVPFGEECESAERCCNDAVLSGPGGYTSLTCSVVDPGDCPNIPHNQSRKMAKEAEVECDTPCDYKWQYCWDGTVYDDSAHTVVSDGSYSQTECNELCEDCIGPAESGSPVIAHGDSMVFYLADIEECWTPCSPQRRYCHDGELDGDEEYVYPSCYRYDCNDHIDCTRDRCIPNRYDSEGTPEDELTWGCINVPDHKSCDDHASCSGADEPGDWWYCGNRCGDSDIQEPDVPPWGVDNDWCDWTIETNSDVSGCQYNLRHESHCDSVYNYECSIERCVPSASVDNLNISLPESPPGRNLDCSKCIIPSQHCDCERDIADPDPNVPPENENTETGCVYFLDHGLCDDSVNCTDNWCDPQDLDDPDPPKYVGTDSVTGCWFEPVDSNCPSDNIDCTYEWCHLTTDCHNLPMHSECNDGFSCTGATEPDPRGTWIAGEGTVHTKEVPGYDGSPESGDDYCDENSGCVYPQILERCTDLYPQTCLEVECRATAADDTFGDGSGCWVRGDSERCNVKNTCMSYYCDPWNPGEYYSSVDGCTYSYDLAEDSCNTESNQCSYEECIITAACTGPDCIYNASCVSNPEFDTVCPAAGFCLESYCDPNDGVCHTRPANTGLSCEDGNDCTSGTICSGGICSGGINNTGSCSDGNPCTENDQCSGGSCQPGDWKDCPDDNNACTIDSCDRDFGGCGKPITCLSKANECKSYAGCDPLDGCQYTSWCSASQTCTTISTPFGNYYRCCPGPGCPP